MVIPVVYIGGDPANRHIPGVPAADHNVTSLAAARTLLRSGLYRLGRADDRPAEIGAE